MTCTQTLFSSCWQYLDLFSNTMPFRHDVFTATPWADNSELNSSWTKPLKPRNKIYFSFSKFYLSGLLKKVMKRWLTQPIIKFLGNHEACQQVLKYKHQRGEKKGKENQNIYEKIVHKTYQIWCYTWTHIPRKNTQWDPHQDSIVKLSKTEK